MFMKILKKLEQYLGFNIFAICGWLYLPCIVYILTFNDDKHYMWLPLSIFITIPFIVSIIAFIIFLIEQIILPKAEYSFFKNKIYRIVSNIGLVIILIFFILLLWNSLIS